MVDEGILRWKERLSSEADNKRYLQSIDLIFSGKVQGSGNMSGEEEKWVLIEHYWNKKDKWVWDVHSAHSNEREKVKG